MNLPIETVEALVAFVNHVGQCGGAVCCGPGEDLLDAAKEFLAKERARQVANQANVVEAVLGGDDKKPRKCIGCHHTNTAQRCQLCKLPVCLPCQRSSGAHPHVVQVRDLPEEELTVEVKRWGYWDANGKKMKIKVTYLKRQKEYLDHQGKTVMGTEQYSADPEGNEVTSGYKHFGRKPMRWLNYTLKAGAKFTIASTEFNQKFFELVD